MKTGRCKRNSIFDSFSAGNSLLSAKLLSRKSCVHDENIRGDDKYTKVKDKTFQLVNFRCSLCHVVFEDLHQQRSHFKSDWHAFNVKMKVNGKEAVNECSFKENYERRDKNDEIELDSEVEDENDDDKDVTVSNDERKPKIDFITDERQCFSVYRCLLEKNSSKENCMNCIHYEGALKELFDENCWLILMMSGGHFAAAVFHKQEVIVHKAIHRYTVRAKRGTVQSQRDGKQAGKSPRSAGAHIRRQNEVALIGEIQDLLQKWKEHVDHSDKILIKWPQHYKHVLFGGKNPVLNRSDSRICKVPFMTGRPSFEELNRIQHELSTIILTDTPIDSKKEDELEDSLYSVDSGNYSGHDKIDVSTCKL